MNKIFIAALCTFCGFLVGLALYRRGLEREKFYRDLTKLCATLINNISFRAEQISCILESAQIESAPLKKNIEEFQAYISGGELFLSGDILNKSEKANVKEFFRELGRYDGETQIGELKRSENEFRLLHAAIKEKNEKQGNMYIKLGLLAGLLVGILLI